MFRNYPIQAKTRLESATQDNACQPTLICGPQPELANDGALNCILTADRTN
jgi:hypothetical protein